MLYALVVMVYAHTGVGSPVTQSISMMPSKQICEKAAPAITRSIARQSEQRWKEVTTSYECVEIPE